MNEQPEDFTHDVMLTSITPPPPPPTPCDSSVVPTAVQFVMLQSVAVYLEPFRKSTAPPSMAEQEVNEQRVRVSVEEFLVNWIAPPFADVVEHPVKVQSVKEEEDEMDCREV